MTSWRVSMICGALITLGGSGMVFVSTAGETLRGMLVPGIAALIAGVVMMAASLVLRARSKDGS